MQTLATDERPVKTRYELPDESTMGLEALAAERDLQLAAVDAIRRARRCGTMFVIREEDVTQRIPPDQTGPYEANLLASAERLNERIQALKQSAPSDLS